MTEQKNSLYKERKQIYSTHFATCSTLDQDLNTKLALVSLLCLVIDKTRDKKPDITSIEVIEMIVKHKLNPKEGFDNYLIGLAVICEDFMYGCTKFDACGFKTSQEIVAKIKEILESWIPF